MSKFSSFVVGESAVALRCLQILLQAEHEILGIYSADRSLQAWADEQGIIHAASQAAFHDLLLTIEYDYLFSINNGWIIPPEVIVRPGTIINYHNSPLPKYAGLHATSWALLKGETQHAISWHEVVSEIDAGAIFKQPTISIAPDDTALSLNARCFEVAVEAFAELVEELASNRAKAFAQDLSQRSYFGQNDRPEAACLLSFDQSTKDLYNLVRALDFGPTHNTLGLAKLWLPEGIVGVGQVSLTTATDCLAGQVLVLDEHGLQIATRDGVLLLSRLTTLEGDPLSAANLSDRYGISVGAVVPTLSPQMRQAISQQNAKVCRYEQTWVKHLAQLSPFVHPYLQLEADIEVDRSLQRYPIELSFDRVKIQGDSDATPSLAAMGAWLLATFAAYCARLSTESAFDLLLQTDCQRHLTPQLFAQSVPVRVQTDKDESFTQFYDRFQAALTRTFRLGSYARDVVARYPELPHEYHLFSMAIALVPTPADLEFPSLNTPMALVAYENGAAPELVHTGALNAVQSGAIVRQLQCVITACIDHSDQPLHSLPLLSTAERQQILFEWNQTAKPYPHDRCIHELISTQAAITPNAAAVRFGDTQLSYWELEQRSNQLAGWLLKLGIEPDGLVGLCLPRSVDLIVGLLGILKAGGAYVPIDPTYPAERIAYLIDDSCPQVIITTEQLQRSRFSKLNNVICLDDPAHVLSRFSAEPVVTQVTPKHLAYMIYTSGSTGKPKGVKIEHRSVVNHSWAMADAFKLDQGDRLLQSASISFDITGEQIYPALFRGAEVVIRPDDLLESFDRFNAFIDSQAITVMLLPTVFWHEWVAELTMFNQKLSPSLRMISVGTEKVLGTRLNQWRNLATRVTFFQGYGPTEATITCTLYKHDGRVFDTYEVPPIGYPLPNTEIYLLDQHLEPVPIGVVGELYVGGDGLARGYHQRPELTAQHFIAHPFRDKGARLYKTGDLARFEPDGQIVYCDRRDRQIKLHGFRIEPGEVEAALHECQGVKQAVVNVHEAAGTRTLVAYVVPQSKQAPSTAQLQGLLKQTLPSYMLPSSIVFISALPLTPNGKIDRQRLPKPTVDKSDEVFLAPRDALERQLAQIWQSVLGIQSIGITDNFFALGGHSLAAVRLADRMQTAFQQDLPLAVIFQAPTIEQFAAVLRQEKPLPSSVLVALQPDGNQSPLFLFQGVDLYRSLASHLAPDRPVYGLSLAMMNEKEASIRSIEALASHYTQEISTVQPTGPYLLGGVSFGGMVALEVARQLQAKHQEVALLALFDTPAPNAFSLKPLSQRMLGHVSNLGKFGLSYVLRRLTTKLHRVNYKLFKLANRTSSNVKQYKFVQEVYEEMRLNYKPQVYSGKIALFVAMDRSAMNGSVCDPALVDIDPQFGWGDLAEGQLDIYEVPGDHLGILKEPQVQALAEVLKQLLQEGV